ncbi:MAG TPA: ABC transporter permease [Bacteroidales bacterium]|nr:ABC transporter permease [Bacteroidales bacterium]
MFKNLLKIAFRNLTLSPKYSILNTIGLSIGMASSILILLWVQDEWSYDRQSGNAGNVFRVVGDRGITNGGLTAITPAPLAKALKEEFPEIIRASRCGMGSRISFKTGNEFIEETAMPVDNEFLKMFNVEFEEGDINKALIEPNSVVLTERIAKKYFGNVDPVGKTVKLTESDEIYTITGIIKNPHNSHLKYDLLIPVKLNKQFEDLSGDMQIMCYNYIELKAGIDSKFVEEKIRDFLITHSSRVTFRISLQNIKKIHLFSTGKYSEDIEGHGSIFYVRVLSLISIFILIIACINFMNLFSAQSKRRAKEIGLRKISGAGRQKIIFQFLGESFLIVFIAHIIAMILVELFLPQFNNLTDKHLIINYKSAGSYSILITVVLFSGLLAGSYPALYLSSLNPLVLMKGTNARKPGHAPFRRTLVILQFSISILLIICTLIIYNQFDFIQNRKPGFNKDDIVYFTTHLNPDDPKMASLKRELGNFPDILNISLGDIPINEKFIRNTDGLNWTGPEKTSDIRFDLLNGDADYASTFQFNLKEGRFFSSEFPTDSFALVINEQAAKIFGFIDPIGKTVTWSDGSKSTIIGVVEDFNYKSMHYKIEPLLFTLRAGAYFFIKIRPGTSETTIPYIKKIFNTYNFPFRLDLHFVSEEYNNMYRNEKRIGKILGYFSLLAIIVSCLGLVGLSAFIAESRTKEIGIRKTNGGKTQEIFILLSKQYLLWVSSSIAIASPVAWYFMNKWLQNFAYRIQIQLWIFVLTGIFVIILSFLTVSIQSYRSACKNPVDTLRYE